MMFVWATFVSVRARVDSSVWPNNPANAGRPITTQLFFSFIMAHVDFLNPSPTVRVVRIESAPFAQNSYVVFLHGKTECLVIDPGFEPQAIIDCIGSLQIKPEAILLTHGHSDHIAGNASLRAQWPTLPIFIGQGDASKLLDPAGNLSGAFGLAITSPPADRLLADRETLDLAGLTMTVHEIPGHSSGHVVFLIQNSTPQLVFGGDVLFREGVGRSDFPDGDFEVLAAGITHRLYTLADGTVVFPGHGDPTTVGHEKRHNPFVPA